ncbi:MAG: pilus assembly protein TadE, partial [Micrococcales bacterium]
MLSGVLSLIVLSVVQLVLVVHVRNILVDSASEGATYAALADRTAADGAARTETLIRRSVSERYAQDVSAEEITVD